MVHTSHDTLTICMYIHSFRCTVSDSRALVVEMFTSMLFFIPLSGTVTRTAPHFCTF